MSTTTSAALFAGAVLCFYLFRRSQRSKLPLPPGPKRLPLIGNLLDIPKNNEWLTFQDWHKQHGDVVCIEALGRTVVILASPEAVTDLLERRSATYSDRAQAPMAREPELMDFEWNLVVMQYNKRWRDGRKMIHSHIHSGVADRYHSIQLETARALAWELLTTEPEPEVLQSIVLINLGAEIVRLTYGIEVGKSDIKRQKYLDTAKELLEALSLSGSPGRFLVEFIPPLRFLPTWVPGGGFLRLASRTRTLHERLRHDTGQAVVDQAAQGIAPPSIVLSMLQDVPAGDESTTAFVKDMGAAIHLAGADTTLSSVVTFLLAMVVYPEVQKRGQAEIDAVVGRERLPDFTDRDRLPFVQAIILETLRWIPVAPLGVPHATSRDDEYKGWHIPKGAIVAGNTFALLHDPEVFPQPEVFKPERFLRQGKDGLEIDPTIRSPLDSAFGYGRRVCPGQFVAQQSVFAAVVTVLATIDLLKALDANGKEITPAADVATHGLLLRANPFPYRVRARSARAAELLKNLVSDE